MNPGKVRGSEGRCSNTRGEGAKIFVFEKPDEKKRQETRELPVPHRKKGTGTMRSRGGNRGKV